MACQMVSQGSGKSFATVLLGSAARPLRVIPTAVMVELSQFSGVHAIWIVFMIFTVQL